MKKPKLYKTPVIIAWCVLAVGLLCAFNLLWLPQLIHDFDGMAGGYALLLVGLFLVITAVVIFYYYGRLNRDFLKMLAGAALLTYVLPAGALPLLQRGACRSR
jgi:hypothetical protein